MVPHGKHTVGDSPNPLPRMETPADQHARNLPRKPKIDCHSHSHSRSYYVNSDESFFYQI